MFIFLSQYIKSIDTDAVTAVKERWIDKNKKWLSSDAKPPLKVAASYLGASGLTVNQVDAEIDWEFFTDTKDMDLADMGTGTKCTHSSFSLVARPDCSSLATPSPASFVRPSHQLSYQFHENGQHCTYTSGVVYGGNTLFICS
jgi:hypothetical protein